MSALDTKNREAYPKGRKIRPRGEVLDRSECTWSWVKVNGSGQMPWTVQECSRLHSEWYRLCGAGARRLDGVRKYRCVLPEMPRAKSPASSFCHQGPIISWPGFLRRSHYFSKAVIWSGSQRSIKLHLEYPKGLRERATMRKAKFEKPSKDWGCFKCHWAFGR